MTLGCRLPPSARAASASSAPHATAFTSPTTPCVNAWMSSTTSSGISSSAQLQPAPCKQARKYDARFLQREAREPLVHGARERTAVVLGQQVRDELLVAGEHEDVDDRPLTEPQLRKHLELAQYGRREALEAVDDDVRVAPVARLVTQEHVEDVALLGGAALDLARTQISEELEQQLLARLAERVDPAHR